MSDHLSRGFVVPVWVRNPLNGQWQPAWVKCPHDSYCPRDPNRADGGDRPDLLEKS